MTLTCCQDHILTDHILTVKTELLSQWMLEAEFRKASHDDDDTEVNDEQLVIIRITISII